MKSVTFLNKGHIFFIIHLDLWKKYSIIIMSSGNARQNVVAVAALLRIVVYDKKRQASNNSLHSLLIRPIKIDIK